MNTEKNPESQFLKDIEVAHLENSFKDLEKDMFPDKDCKLTENIEKILNNTKSSEVVAFGVTKILETQDFPQYYSYLKPWEDLDDARIYYN